MRQFIHKAILKILLRDNAYIENPNYRQIQLTKLSKLVKYSNINVPYYSNLFEQNNINSVDDFQKIPFLTKQLIKNNIDLLKSNNLHKNSFVSNSTSGSTGESMNFYSDKKAKLLSIANEIKFNGWTGWLFGQPIIMLWGAVKDNKLYSTFKKQIVNSKFLLNTKILSSFNMKDHDMRDYHEIINKDKPKLIIGYPSTLETFAKFICDNQLIVHSPLAIITSGETLNKMQREIVQNTFQCKVYNRYGCREVGLIAHECNEQNGLHIHSDHLILELVNKNGELCKPGELGDIVITDLDNYTFPFIRYKIGDVGRLSNSTCKCGKTMPLLKSVEGRSFDVIIGTNGNNVPGTYFTLLKYEIKGIEKFQVRQKSFGELIISIVANNLWNEFEKNKLLNSLHNKLGADMAIDVKIVSEIYTNPSGKFRWIVSEMSQNTNKN